MWYIIKVQGTVGKGEVMAVGTKLRPDEIQPILHPSLFGYGEYSSIQWIEQYAVPNIDVSQYKIDRVVMLDEMI